MNPHEASLYVKYFLIGICCAIIILRIVKVYRPIETHDLEVAFVGIYIWPLVLIVGSIIGALWGLKLLAEYLFNVKEEKELS